MTPFETGNLKPMLENFRRNSGLSTDPDWRRFVVRWSLVSLVLIAIAAYFSYGFFQFDEHYQVVELVGLKLGKTPKTELPWEFRGRIRPWLQPSIYYVAAKAMIGLGVENPFLLATGFRAISGLCGWLAVTAPMLSAYVIFNDNLRRRLAVVVLACCGWCPIWRCGLRRNRSRAISLPMELPCCCLARRLRGRAARMRLQISQTSQTSQRWRKAESDFRPWS